MLRDEEKMIWTHDDIWSDAPFHHTSAFIHKNYRIGMHTHSFYEVNVVLAGQGIHCIEGQSIFCACGDVYVIPPRVRHGYDAVDASTGPDVFHLLLHNQFMTRFANDLAATEGFRLLFEIEPELRAHLAENLFLRLNESEYLEIEPFINTLSNMKDETSEGARVMRNGLALFLIAKFCRIYASRRPQRTTKNDPKTYHIMKSIEWMQENLFERITAEDMLERTNLSRATYFRLFKEMFDTTPGEYLLRYRLRRAKELLLGTRETVTSIALSCGFFDSSHFIRCFCRAEGISPSEYRKRKI